MTTPVPPMPQPSGTVPRPVWGADCPVSMPLPVPADEAKLIGMYGFSMTQYRLVHDISGPEYEQLSVPVFAPVTGNVRMDSAGIDSAGPPGGTP